MQTSFRYGIQMPLACIHNCSASNDEILNCGILFFYVLSRNVGEGLNLYVKHHTTKSRSICFTTKYSSSQSAGIEILCWLFHLCIKYPCKNPIIEIELNKLCSWVWWLLALRKTNFQRRTALGVPGLAGYYSSTQQDSTSLSRREPLFSF